LAPVTPTDSVSPPAEDRAAFIRANTRLVAPPLAPEMRLHLADEAVELWTKTEAELQASGLPPPFWAFAWAGGQALARWIGDHSDRLAGCRVLDFASGSGIVAIAAALAGAAKVEASEIDPFAQAAIALNAGENRVAVDVLAEDVIGTDRGWDVVLAGDVAYERDMAAAVFAWLERLAGRGALALVGDPRRSYLALDRLECLAEYSVPTTRALEDAEIKRTSVFAFKAARRAG
jgi:predicted nicotinamide N-methyase